MSDKCPVCSNPFPSSVSGRWHCLRCGTPDVALAEIARLTAQLADGEKHVNSLLALLEDGASLQECREARAWLDADKDGDHE